MNLLPVFVLGVMVVAVFAQTNLQPDPLTVGGKFEFHAVAALGPQSVLETILVAGADQVVDRPPEWHRTADGYGRRVGSIAGGTFAQNLFAFGLDSAFHEDPRYQRAKSRRFWHRVGHLLQGTVITRTDEGGRTLSIWRFGSAYGAGYLSTLWHPGPTRTARLGFENGSAILGFDVLTNAATEFWPDIRRKILGH